MGTVILAGNIGVIRPQRITHANIPPALNQLCTDSNNGPVISAHSPYPYVPIHTYVGILTDVLEDGCRELTVFRFPQPFRQAIC